MKNFNLLSDLKDSAFYFKNLKRQFRLRLNATQQTEIVLELNAEFYINIRSSK